MAIILLFNYVLLQNLDVYRKAENKCALLKYKSVKCYMFRANFRPPSSILHCIALIVCADCIWGELGGPE